MRVDTLFSLGLLLAIDVITKDVVGDCDDGDIRFVPTDHQYADRLLIQVCTDNKWGYVCGHENTFTDQDAAVTCNQLGYKADENSNMPLVLHNDIDGFLSYRALYCTGLENRLADCANHELVSETSKCKKSGLFYYAAVNCSYDEVSCINGDTQEEDGVLQICTNGQWYYLCGDADGWNDDDAAVACRHLGENPSGATSLFKAQSDDEELLYSIRFHCSGYEEALVNCPKTLTTSCDSESIAVVQCGEYLEPPTDIDLSVSCSQLTVAWADSSDSYGHHISCTSINNTTASLQSYAYQISTTAKEMTEHYSVVFTNMAPGVRYNCCVSTVFEDSTSEPICESFLLQQQFPLSCSSATSTSSSSSLFSMSTQVPESSNNESTQFLEGYGPWVYGFLGGLVLGSVFMSILCGCVLIVCRMRRGRQIRKTDQLAADNFMAINMNARDVPGGSSNPLYGVDQSYSSKYEPEEKLQPKDEYSYVDRRPPAPVPDQITPYHTVLANNERYSDNERKYQV